MAHVADNAGMASGMMGMGSGMMGSGMMGMSPGMMKDMMSSGMMNMGPDMMKGMMGSGMGREAARGTANIIVVTGGARSGQSVLGRLIRHPAMLLGLGVAAGILIYKYRKQILSSKDE